MSGQRWITSRRFARKCVILMGLLAQIIRVHADDAPPAEVTTDSGKVRGQLNTTLFSESPFYAFLGIPYAEKPINDLRFKAPKKILPWIKPLDAFEFGSDCVQIDFQTKRIHGSEDCLYLNVFVPAAAIEANDTELPVIVVIVGDSFQSGSAKLYGPDFLIEQNAIVVTLNYRLGAIGFMSLNLADYSGNMGLKDQVLALKWIQSNINHFGGGNNITLLGHGSGAICVSLHTMSKASKGLFQNAIMLSGSALNPMIPRSRDHLPLMYNLAEHFHYTVDNNRDLIAFLKQIDANLLIKRTYQEFHYPGFGRLMANLIWSPIVEHPHATESFLGQTPFEVITSADYTSNINALFGYTFEEMYGDFINEMKDPNLLRHFDEMFEFQLPLRNAKLKFHSKEYKEMAVDVRNLYLRGNRIRNDTIAGFQALMTDVWFLYGIDLNARLQSDKSTGHTFLATFSLKSDWNLSSRKGKQLALNFNYSHHLDQLPYLFRLGGQSLLPDSDYRMLDESSAERESITRLTAFYVNFARYGNPMPDSQQPMEFGQIGAANEPEYYYFDITNDGIAPKCNPNREHVQFWNGVFELYSAHWQTREFNLNSLAVKVPLMLLVTLILSILFCKSVKLFLRKKRRAADDARSN